MAGLVWLSFKTGLIMLVKQKLSRTEKVFVLTLNQVVSKPPKKEMLVIFQQSMQIALRDSQMDWVCLLLVVIRKDSFIVLVLLGL
jgi:hypothetical protein